MNTSGIEICTLALPSDTRDCGMVVGEGPGVLSSPRRSADYTARICVSVQFIAVCH